MVCGREEEATGRGGVVCLHSTYSLVTHQKESRSPAYRCHAGSQGGCGGAVINTESPKTLRVLGFIEDDGSLLSVFRGNL